MFRNLLLLFLSLSELFYSLTLCISVSYCKSTVFSFNCKVSWAKFPIVWLAIFRIVWLGGLPHNWQFSSANLTSINSYTWILWVKQNRLWQKRILFVYSITAEDNHYSEITEYTIWSKKNLSILIISFSL